MDKSLDELIADRKRKIDETRRKLEQLMTVEKIYRDSTLSLEKLARQMDVNKRLLSETLNSGGEEGFKRYVNAWRVKDAIRQMIMMKNSNISLEIIRENAGFGTRSAFYEQFRQVTGLSPAEFYKGKINEYEQ